MTEPRHNNEPQGKPMRLTLDEGNSFPGISFGADVEVKGEVVFNTAMTGYVETLTDPSYRGQILVLTYPLQGNYGVPRGPHESRKIQVQGLVVSHYSDQPNHHASAKTLGAWLKSEGVPAICGADTRTITRLLRELGTAPGAIEFASKTSMFGNSSPSTIDMSQVLSLVSEREITRCGNGDHKILMIDTGSKENIVRSLVKRGSTVVRAFWDTSWEDYLPEVDGVFLTNGPGDPMLADRLIGRIRGLLRHDLPIFGICFGHQILSLAAGAKTYKLKYAHRSVNQPVKDLLTGRCYITSQNHGYVVQTESLSRDWQPWFVNLNDGTNEGICHKTKPFSSVQFHPEASPGPNDTSFLFDRFIQTVAQTKKTKPSSRIIQQLKEREILV